MRRNGCRMRSSRPGPRSRHGDDCTHASSRYSNRLESTLTGQQLTTGRRRLRVASSGVIPRFETGALNSGTGNIETTHHRTREPEDPLRAQVKSDCARNEAADEQNQHDDVPERALVEIPDIEAVQAVIQPPLQPRVPGNRRELLIQLRIDV